MRFSCTVPALVSPGATMFELHSNFTLEGSKTIVDGQYPTEHQLHETLESRSFCRRIPATVRGHGDSIRRHQAASRTRQREACNGGGARAQGRGLARHASHNGGGGHCEHEAKCSAGQTHRVPRSGCLCNFGCWPEDEPEHSYIHGQEQQVDEPEPDALKEDIHGIWFR